MKLAQALNERADIQKRLEQLKRRLMLNAKVQEGEQPAERPELLMAELDTLTAQLETLITRINLTNSAPIDGGESITALLARRDCMALKVSALRDFLDEASSTVMRGMRSEIIIKSTVSVTELRRQVDAQSKALRELDAKIQELNWTTELM